MSFERSLLFACALCLTPMAAASQDLNADERLAIEEAVEAAEPDASAFATEIAARAERYAEEARELVDIVNTRIKAIEASPDDSVIDFGEMLQGAAQVAEIKDAPPPIAGVMVFVSFGMPEASLKALVVDARQAGIPVMLQGFVDGSLSATAQRMHDLLGDTGGAEAQAQALGGVLIDPRAFRVFDVRDVPAFIATASPLPDCDGLTCSAPAPPHDRIAGNMSLKAALSALASEGRESPAQANAALQRLEVAQ